MTPYIYPGIDPLKQIVNKASNVFGIKPKDIWKKTRIREYVQSRWFVIYYLQSQKNSTEKEIVKITGCNRCTVKHSIEQMNNLFETDRFFKSQYEEFENNLMKANNENIYLR